jgi:hypothetical protein
MYLIWLDAFGGSLGLSSKEQEETFNIRFPRALERIKTLAKKMQ